MTSRFIKHVPQQRVFALDGVTVLATLTHSEFLLQCTAQPVFLDGKVGIEAVEFAIDARQAIRLQPEESASARGCFELDETVTRALKLAVEKGQWNGLHAEALLPFCKAALEPLKEAPPAPAGSEAARAN